MGASVAGHTLMCTGKKKNAFAKVFLGEFRWSAISYGGVALCSIESKKR